MSRILTPFERHLKEQISDFEMPYDQKSWFELEKSMGQRQSGRYAWLVALAASVVVTATGVFAFYRSQFMPATAHTAALAQRFETPLTINPVIKPDYHSPYQHPRGLASLDQAGSSVSESNQNSTSTNTDLSTSAQQSQNSANSNQTNSGNNESLEVTSNAIESTSTVKKADNLITFESSVRQACEGTEVEFEAKNAPENADHGYLWNFGDGHFSTSPRPKHKFAKAGNYDVSLSVTSNEGKINTTVMNDMITINPAPQADFRWEFVNEDPMKPEVKIVNTSEDAITYEWTTSNGNSSVAQNPTIAIDGSNKKMVALSVRNDYGCEDGAVKHVSINSDFSLNAPGKYTVGKGYFLPSGLKQSKVNFVMSIYSQDGTKVFETSNRLKGWDGALPGGLKAANGETYNWKVIITNDITLEQKYFNGILTISP